MRTILALETSTDCGSVALWCDGTVAAEWSFASERSHNSLIFAPLAEALTGTKPDLIAVGTGPGSYSGIRVALAAAVGLGLAYGVPVIGWPSLTAFDGPDRYRVVGDARRGSYFAAEVDGGELVGEVRLVPAEDVARLQDDGVPVFTFDASLAIPTMVRVTPGARWLAGRAARLGETTISMLAATSPEPLYLRSPFITTPNVRRARREGRRSDSDFG